MDPLARLRTAAAEPNAYQLLREAVTSLQESGLSQKVISHSLTQLQLEIHSLQPDSSAEEAVLGVLDAMEGWCHPSVSQDKTDFAKT
jgi:hypothetical protein